MKNNENIIPPYLRTYESLTKQREIFQNKLKVSGKGRESGN